MFAVGTNQHKNLKYLLNFQSFQVLIALTLDVSFSEPGFSRRCVTIVFGFKVGLLIPLCQLNLHHVFLLQEDHLVFFM